jgi:hypothetical protein
MNMKRNAIQKWLRLLGIAGVALIWLAVPATCGAFTTSMGGNHLNPPKPPSNAMKSETGEVFEEFVHFQKSGERFIYASTAPEGSGGFRTEAIFWIAPDGVLHPIEFEHAGRAYEGKVRKGEILLTGGSGIIFSHGSLGFEFDIANEADSLCCPTAGRIRGTYKIVGGEHFDAKSKEYSCTFKLVVATYKRELVPSDGLKEEEEINEK